VKKSFEPWWVPATLGLLGSLAGASAGAVLAGLLDAWLAGALGPLVEAAIGLIAPLALLLGALVFGVRCLFWEGRGWSGRRLIAWLNERQGQERALWQVTPPLVALALALGLLAVAGVSARVLGAGTTGLAGGGLIVLSCLGVVLGLVAGTRILGDAAAARLGPGAWSPAMSTGGSAVGALLLLTMLIALGETGGGGGPLAILGVLRRQELDLRAPGLCLLIASAALSFPSPRRKLMLAVALACVVAPLALTLRAYRGASLDDGRALSIERHAPLGRIALGTLRKLSDRDRDGVGRAFAGGDCDDRDPSVSPRAEDLPGNGRDEDCIDGDARLPSQAEGPPSPNAPAKSARAAFPDDLNVVLITIDTLRADLGYMGNPRPLSPNLDRLAAQSVVFERAYSLASYTGKSMGPLLIGKYASELDGGFLHFNRYTKSEVFLQERLQAAGVRTVSVQGYWYFFQNSGFERGFHVIDSSAAPKVAAIEGDQSSNSDEQSDAAIRQLGAPELLQNRFFMWLHYVDPHAEYARHAEHDFGNKPRERYDGEVAFVDHHVGRFLEALSKTPFGARTALIVTSDHGEAFGEHGMIRHGFELWEELVRVPLILKVPGVPPRRVTARRSGIDLVPTVLDLFKVEHDPKGPRDFLSGESLLPDFVSQLPAASEAIEGASPAQRPVFMDMARGPHNAERQALIDEDLKLTVSDGRVLGLYDLASDPEEKRDLAKDPAQLEPIRRKYSAFKSRLRRAPTPQP